MVVDSYAYKTAKEADWHIAPKPGTDGALAMAMMNVIIEEGLVDQDYVDNYTVGYKELAERAKTRTQEWADKITGIAPADIRKFAREYSTTTPAAIRLGVALERSYGGSQAHSRSHLLVSLNWRVASYWWWCATIPCVGASL